MKSTLHLCLFLATLFLLATLSMFGQAPTGTISGVVMDESGAVIPGAELVITNKATGATRTIKTGADGSYTAPSLLAGTYEVKANVNGFRTTVRDAEVVVGGTTTVEMRMQVGQSKDVITVEAASAQVEYEKNSIDGVVNREKIQDLPLNGRSFLQLASLEPGVTVSAGTTNQYNRLFSISILGGNSGRTNITVDGGSIRDAIEDTGASMNFSQEVVQEFQLSSAVFDLSTGIGANGAVNVVTRTGSNDFHGSGYFFFRDHNMAAYPGLARNALAPDPFFARRNPGAYIGGPIMKDKLFFFFNYEYMNQVQAVTVQPNAPSVAPLTGIFGSPYLGHQLSVRFDYRLNSNNTLFARYSHDGNNGVGPNGSGVPLPSHWLVNTNWADQSVLGWTSTIRPTIVNDFRFNYQFWSNRNLFPTSSNCGASCVGLGFPEVSIAGTNVLLGDTSNATQGRDLRRFNFQDNLDWQRGAHHIRAGGDVEYAPGTGFWGYCDPSCTVVAGPEAVFGSGIPASVIPLLWPKLPKTISSNADVLNLPFEGASTGIGDSSQPPPYNIGDAKLNKRYHFFLQDSWKVTPHLTVNFGSGWEFESTLTNRDLPKPAFLAPLIGNDLSPTDNNYFNFEPAVGFAWNPDKSGKTVIRGGAGVYYDTEQLYQRLQERSEIGPIGNGRILFSSTGFTNIFPGIVAFGVSDPKNPCPIPGFPASACAGVPVGAPIPQGLTTMTLGQFLQIQNQQIPAIQASMKPQPLSAGTQIDLTKQGTDLYAHNYPVTHGPQMSIGVQRQLRTDMVISVDFVRRVFTNVSLGALDYNRYNQFIGGVRTPVIPVCKASQVGVIGQECSTGAITFWDPAGRNVYNGLLVKLDKRFSKRYQFTASYAFQHQYGYNSIYDYNNFGASWAPQGGHHVLNISGVVDLPWGFQLGLISSTSSAGPIEPTIGGVDLNGSGAGTTTPLPGFPLNGINDGASYSQLVSSINNWNTTLAGHQDARGKTIPFIQMPSSRAFFGRTGESQDLRLTKTFTIKERYRISILGEMFNVLNYANIGGASYGLDTTSSLSSSVPSVFGIPTQRSAQTFGSGGPRATQVGARIQF
ncbi:MAG TPA: carboxypeptidase regulatory-like domain-containing protein [Bryobacteraceae bacterium]|nr:carboxypeptidase regulatory-like domain-containing protein [Bryobacteraceae bacterium]